MALDSTEPDDTDTKPAKKRMTRAERRAKQRELNPVRAEKMHKARLDDPNAPKPRNDDLPAINIGCSGWFYWDWKGKFYPTQMPTSEWFSHYAETFDTVELNAPFYAWPTVANVKNWSKQSCGKPFVYTVKACELITHIKRFNGTGEWVKDFGYVCDLLGPVMGCLLFQLPPNFHYTRERLDAILDQLEPNRRNVVEFRHASWWNDEVYAAFRDNNVIFCACSAPGLPDDLIKTADEIYVRFHGPERWYSYDYSEAELSDWAQRIRDSGAKRIWAYFNNDYNAFAIKNGERLAQILTGRA
ncbi:MAG: DUF72 domain-containing protein [Asticcacaulis sp.]